MNKFLQTCIGTAAVLLAAGFFIRSVNSASASASSPVLKTNSDLEVGIYPFGVVNGKAYWLEYNSSGWHYKGSAIADWKEE